MYIINITIQFHKSLFQGMYNLEDVAAQYVSQINRSYDKDRDILYSEVLPALQFPVMFKT